MAFYLPPGWTAERLNTATLSDIQQLPPEDLYQLDLNHMSSADNSARDYILTAQLKESRRLERIALGLPPVPVSLTEFEKPDVDPYVQVVEELEYSEYGYLCFRTFYEDEGKWERWQEKFEVALEGALIGCCGQERVADRLFVKLVDDDDLAGGGCSDVVQGFNALRENGDVSPGLDVGMCLMLDEAAVDSLLEPVEGLDPWLWAVDVHYDFDGENMEDGYQGRFKVAIEFMISELWPMLAGTGMQPKYLWQFANPIFKGAGLPVQPRKVVF